MSFRLLTVIACLGAAATPSPSKAQRATIDPSIDQYVAAENLDEICRTEGALRVVAPMRLAGLLFSKSAFSPSSLRALFSANSNATDDALLLAVFLDKGEANRRRLAEVDAERGDGVSRETAKLDAMRDALYEHVTRDAFDRPNSRLRVTSPIDADSVVAEDGLTRRSVVLKQYLSGAAGRMECPPRKKPVAAGALNLSTALRFRGTNAALIPPRPSNAADAAKTAAFNQLKPAEVAFSVNEATDVTTTSVRFAAGIDIARALRLQSAALIPFVQYENVDVDGAGPASSDVHFVAPGFVAAYLPEQSFAAGAFDEASVSLRPVFDFEQDAKTLRGEIRLRLATFLFSERLLNEVISPRYSPFRIQAKAFALLDAAHVFDAGTSADLQTLDDDQYVGLGGDLSARVTLNTTRLRLDPVFEGVFFEARYRAVGIVSSGLSDQERLFFEAGFTPPGLQIVRAAISYEVGENIESFQREELFKLSLGVRY